MVSNLKPTPLQKLRHKKAWRLKRVFKELIKQGTPVSWPTLLKIDHGCKTVIVRGPNREILEEKKVAYHPYERTLSDIGKLFKVSSKKVYEDRSKE